MESSTNLEELKVFLRYLVYGHSKGETLLVLGGAQVLSMSVSDRGRGSVLKGEPIKIRHLCLSQKSFPRTLLFSDLSSDNMQRINSIQMDCPQFIVELNPHKNIQTSRYRNPLGNVLDQEIVGKLATEYNDDLVILIGPQRWNGGTYVLLIIPKASEIFLTYNESAFSPEALGLIGFQPGSGISDPSCSWMSFPSELGVPGEIQVGLVPKSSDRGERLHLAVYNGNAHNNGRFSVLRALSGSNSHGIANVYKRSKSFEAQTAHDFFEIDGSITELGTTLHRLMTIIGEST